MAYRKRTHISAKLAAARQARDRARRPMHPAFFDLFKRKVAEL